MAGLNNYQIIGRLGADPEARFTKNEKPMTNFSVAVDSGWGDSKETLWVDVTAFNRLAEVAAEYLKKGSQVYISGPVTLNVFERKNGDPGATIRVTANQMTLLGSKDNGNGGSSSREDADEREPVGSGRRGSSSRSSRRGGDDDLDNMPF